MSKQELLERIDDIETALTQIKDLVTDALNNGGVEADDDFDDVTEDD